MSNISEGYDVSLTGFEKQPEKTSSLFIKPPSNFGVEAYSQLLPPIMKLGRIFSLKQTPTEYKKAGIFLKQQVGTAIVPLVDSSDKVMDTVKAFFGTGMYKRMMYNYVFPRKTEYKNPLIPGSKKFIKLQNTDEFGDIVKRGLPSLTQVPTYIIRNIKNSIFDFSCILKETLPNSVMCKRPNVLPTSQDLILQSIYRIIFGTKDEDLSLYRNCYKTTLQPVAVNFKSVIIPFEMNATNMKLATVFMDPKVKNIPLVYRRDPAMSSCLGLLKFVIGLMQDDMFNDDPLKHDLAAEINKMNHCVFVFYNKTHAFYIDIQEFKEKKMKFDAIYRYMRTALKTMIALNANVISPLEVDENAVESDEDGITAENKIDEKIVKSELFKDDIEITMNSKTDFAKISKDLNSGDNVIDKIENKIETTSTLLAKAKKNLDDRISLGHTDVTKTANSVVVPVAKDPTGIDNAIKDLNKIDKLASMLTPTSLNSEDFDDDYDDGFDDFDDEDETPETAEDANEDGSSIDNVEEDDDDRDIEDDDYDGSDIPEDDDDNYDDDLEGKDFIEEKKKEQDEEYKQSIVNSIKETLEGKMTEKQKKYLESIKDKYKSINFDENETLEDVLNRANTVSIDIKDTGLELKDKSYNKALLNDFTRSYVNKTLAKDIVATVKSFSDDNKESQMIITGFEKKDVSDQFNYVERYKFELRDKNGKQHNITFKIPKIDNDGFMYINGNKKLLKKQMVLKPVTKTSPDDVYVMSNYNKVHIFRDGLIINKNTIVLKKFLTEVLLNAEQYSKFIIVGKGNNIKPNEGFQTSIEYDDIAGSFNTVTINPTDPANTVTFYFNQNEIRNKIQEFKLPFDPNGILLPIGIEIVKGKPNLITNDITLSSDSVAKSILKKIQDISPELETKIKTDLKKVKPNSKKMMSKIEIQSKKVPLIVFLSGMFGFSEVVKRANLKVTFVKKGETELSPEVNSYIESENVNSIKFADGTLYYDMYPIDVALLLNGLLDLKPEELSYESLNNMGTYVDYTMDKFKKRNLIRGWTAFRQLFLDPKTLECLNALHLPTEMVELMVYANSLLQNNDFKFSGELDSWRVRDYEMINTFLYESIAENYAKYNQKGKSRTGFSIPEDDVLTRINKSLVIVNYDNTSPINELKERGTVTFKGPQGINSDRAFSLDKRGQTLSSVGTIAISSVDNGNVGIVRQMTINPKLLNTLGFIDATSSPEDIDKMPASTLMSAEENCFPYLNRDDPRRIGFTTGQTKHVVPAPGFDVPIVGTGYEQVLPYKVSDTYGYKAKGAGKIVKVDEANRFVVIQYKDGSTDRIDYGDKYHKNSDFFLTNNLEVNVKEGQIVKEGEMITYNKDFFKRVMGKLMFTQGAMARVAIHEGEVTEEDSSAISWRLSKKLATTVIKRKQLILGASANIIKCVNVGDHVLYGDPLMVYENSQNKDDDQALFDLLGDADESILDKIARHQASANYSGKIKDIRVYWTTDPELMSETSRKFVKQYINRIKKDIASEEESTGKKSNRRLEIEVTKPGGPMKDRINGALMPKDGGILVEFYIEHVMDRFEGDKNSINTSLKTVTQKIMQKDTCAYRINPNSKFNTIDVVQSTIGVLNRMVTSIFFVGFLQKVIFERGKSIADEFLEEIK